MIKTIKGKVVTIFSLILFLSFLIIVTIAINRSSLFLHQESEKGVQTATTETQKVIRSRMDQQIQFIEGLAARKIVDDNTSWDEKCQVMQDEAKRMGYQAIVISDLNGNYTRFDKEKTSGNISDRDYFQQAKAGKSIISDVVISRSDGKPIILVATPIKRNNNIIGVLYGIKEQNGINEVISDFSYGKTGFSYIISKKGQTIANKDIKQVINQVNVLDTAKKDSKNKEFLQLLENQIIKGNTGIQEYSYNGKGKIVAYKPITGTEWVLVTSVDSEEIFQGEKQLQKILIILGAIIIILAGVFTYIGSGYIVNPILHLTDMIKKISNYDLTNDENNRAMKYVKRKDEIGTITNSLIIMQKNFTDLIKNIANNSQRVASSSENLTTVIQQCSVASEDVAKTIQEIAKGAVNQANDAQHGALRVNELGEKIAKNQQDLKSSSNAAEEINNLKEEGTQIIRDLVEKTELSNSSYMEINNIIINTNESAEKIENASEMIKNIADQTNLLALNAAIEAARAGEAGKGFAVVADEIRRLSEQSSHFTEEINFIIKDLNSKTSNGVKAIEEVSKTVASQTKSVEMTSDKFEGIAEAIEKMKKIMASINKSAEQMETKKCEIVDVIQNLSAISEENAAGTEEASASVEEQTASMAEIANDSEVLAKLAEEMQLSIQKFKY